MSDKLDRLLEENAEAMADLTNGVKKLIEIANDPRTSMGFAIAKCEAHYNAKYVGTYSIPGVGDGPFVVFYVAEPDLEKGHKHYIGLWRNPLDLDDCRIYNAEKITEACFAAIEITSGTFICSRTVHDMVGSTNGAWLDGGPFYTRCSPDHRPTHTMIIEDGAEVFLTKEEYRAQFPEDFEDAAPSDQPPAIVGPAVAHDDDVIDAEWTEESVHIAPGTPDDISVDGRFIEIKTAPAVLYRPNGMTLLLADVRAFHLAVDQPVRYVPAMPVQSEIDLRFNLIDEEYLVEFKEACARGDIVAAADALGDIIYVVVGTALHFGIPLDRCWQEIHDSNMTKVDPNTGKVRKREDGKVLKPESYEPPNIRRALGLE